MFLNDYDKKKKQENTLPQGYQVVNSGNVYPGDLRWNPYTDEWNNEPITSPKHDIIIGSSVTNFHGICRKQINS